MIVNEQNRSEEAVEIPQAILSETETQNLPRSKEPDPELKLKSPSQVRRPRSGFQLTPREANLLEFVLDQKFAGSRQLYFRFYQNDASDHPGTLGSD